MSPMPGIENGCAPDSLNSFRYGRGYAEASQNRSACGSSPRSMMSEQLFTSPPYRDPAPPFWS